METFKQYLKDSYEEMKKVTWPTQKEITNYTILVVVVSVGVATFLGGLDFIFNIGLENLIQSTDIPTQNVPTIETIPTVESEIITNTEPLVETIEETPETSK